METSSAAVSHGALTVTIFIFQTRVYIFPTVRIHSSSILKTRIALDLVWDHGKASMDGEPNVMVPISSVLRALKALHIS